MPDRDSVINDLNVAKLILCNSQMLTPEMCIKIGQAIKSALDILKEQEDEKKRIMKVIWDTLHEGLSIDTVADQDWVYEQIRHRIEDT